VPPRFGHAEQASLKSTLQSILGIRFFTSAQLETIFGGLFLYMMIICLLLVLTVLLRNQKIAVAAYVLTIASLLGFGNAWTFAINLVAAALIFFLLMRFGFLALAVSFFTAIGLFSSFPITCETSAWYAGYSFAALGSSLLDLRA
jgi:hypothetical protein